MKGVVDLSVALKSLDTPVFPGVPQPLRTTYQTVKENGYSSFVWTFAEHTGTHVDAPAHFFDGKLPIDRVPIKRFVSEGAVLDFSRKPEMYSITTKDLKGELRRSGRKVGPGWILLFYTGYTSKSRTRRWMNHPGLSGEACKYISTLGVNAIGFDAPSPDHEPYLAHKILLPNTICIYENLSNLEKLLKKSFIFVGLPLALSGGSASPVRAIALLK